jgi:5,10-methylenetetrahydromethanopterin reductase
MQIGVNIDPRPAPEMLEYDRLAEDIGLDILAHADSQAMYREVYSTLALAADRTTTPRLPIITSNPLTRHITVTASAIATIDEISGGRAVLGLARGDSAVRNTEMEPASLSMLVRFIETLKELFRAGEAEWNGGQIRLQWPADKVDVPVFLVGEGPKSLTAGGEVADGVIHGGSNMADELEWAQSRVARGAERAERDHDEVEFWTVAPCAIDSDVEAATDRLRHTLASKAHITSRGPMTHVPDELVPNFEALGDEYRSSLHNQYDRAHNAGLLEKHDLREFMRDNWAIAGSPSDVLKQIRSIMRRGPDGLILRLRIEDPGTMLRTLGDKVLPHL